MTCEVATQTMEDEVTPDVFEVNVFALHTGESPFFGKPNDERPHLNVMINGQMRSPLVDTGAMVCVLAVPDKEELAAYDTELLPIKVFINTVQAHRTPALGVMNLTYEFNNRRARVPTVIIIAKKPQIIAGMNFCRAFDVHLAIAPNCYKPKNEASIFDASDMEDLGTTTVVNVPMNGSSSPSPLTSVKNLLEELVRHTAAILAKSDQVDACRSLLSVDVALESSDVNMAREDESQQPNVIGVVDTKELASQLNEPMSKVENECNGASPFLNLAEFVVCESETQFGETTHEIRTADGNDDTVRDVLPEKFESVTQPHELERMQRKMLDDVIEMFPYTPEKGPLNKNPFYVQHINLMAGAVPVQRRQYPLSPYVLKEVRVEIDKLLERDIIEPIESSPWRWPFLWVKKKNGGGRICLDARDLNKLTIPDAYPSLNVDQILRNLPKAKFITGLDMTQAFHQLEIAKEDREKTAFAVDNRFYCYKRAVMGFRNSPADLTKMLANIFHDMAPEVYHYVDDFIIMSPTFEGHVKTLKEVARRLKANNLTISREKSCFCFKRLSFLGYILTERGLEANPERIAPIMNYKRPERVKDVRRLVGLANWYRRFIHRAAEMLAPLSDLITKDSKQKIVWTEAAENAFEELKKCLTSAPILMPADYTLPFKVYTDASLIAGAGILAQEQDGRECVIAFHSVKFSKAQQNYSATERECLAVLSSIERFRPWVDGVHFTVVTDHASLKWLQELKEPHGKLARWAVRLQAFDMTFEHRPGKQMDAPDALSRAVNIVDIKPDQQTDDPWYNQLIEMASKGKTDHYKLENGFLYRRGRFHAETGDRIWSLCVPNEMVESVLKEKHDTSCHMGYWKTLRSIQNSYYWKGMHQDIYDYVTTCVTCRMIKPTNEATKVPTGAYTDPVGVGRTLYIDFIGKLPSSKRKRHMHAIVCLDGFSRFVFTQSFVRASAEKLVEFLEREIFFKFDVPELIISDNGVQFRSNIFKDLLRRYKIRHKRTPYYHAQSNAVEASNKIVKTSLRAQIMETDGEHSDWAEQLPFITMKMNTTPLTSTGQSAFFCLFGREKAQTGDEHRILFDANPERTPEKERIEVLRDQIATQSRTAFETNRRTYDLRARIRKFKVGDVVFVHNRILSSGADQYSRKLAPLRKQAIVKEKIGQDTYALTDMSGADYGHYHANDLMLR